MSFNSNTELAQKFIKKYKDLGFLLDVYSEEFSSKIKIKGMSSSDFNNYDEKYGSKYRNHLLLILCDSDSGASTLVNDLVELVPKYKDHLVNHDKDVFHAPSFTLINLISNQILGVGLGRNAQLFMTDVETMADITLSDPKDINAQVISETSDKDYLKSFLEHDHAGLIFSFLTTIDELGTFVYEQECDLTEYQYEELCGTEVNEDGDYELDGTIYSSDEKDELINSHEDYEDLIDARKNYIKQFFPNIDFSFAYVY